MDGKTNGEQRRGPPVVTLAGLAPALRSEAALESAPAQPVDPVKQALALNRYRRVLETLEQETAESDPELFVTAQDRDTSLLQSRIAEDGTLGRQLPDGGQEVKFGEGLEDPIGWAMSTLDWVDARDNHRLVRPASSVPEKLPSGRVRIALLADWGSGLYGAPVSAISISSSGTWDLLVHLGDVYYSGTTRETRQRFRDLWPGASARVSRGLNGNHEMYPGGYAYFDETLPAFGQASSYFAMANDDWLLVFLDTAYIDHDIDTDQRGWVNSVVGAAGGRRVLFFSHHQLFSRFNAQGPRLQAALAPLLDTGAITGWYWGHEHECMVYEPHPSWGLLARCLGHGGIPKKRRDEVRAAPAERVAGDTSFRRIAASSDAPASLALDGPNPHIPKKADRFSPHGYMTLELNGGSLVERVHLPDGAVTLEESW